MHYGDSRDVLKTIADASIDSVVTDPPYALVSIVKRFGGPAAAPAKEASGAYARASAGFMGQQWDTGETAFAIDFWAEVLRVLKPGGHVVAFSGTRTYHRLAVAIEDAGFEIRDQLAWVYGTGFPKSHNVAIGFEKTHAFKTSIKVDGKDVEAWFYRDTGEPLRREPPFRDDRANEWAGWGTALKPAWEPIILARKTLVGTVVHNVLGHGTGALNIGACRIEGEDIPTFSRGGETAANTFNLNGNNRTGETSDLGRFPANLVHDGSPEVLLRFPETTSNSTGKGGQSRGLGFMGGASGSPVEARIGDSGSAARFFYCAKASKRDRAGSKHPTVKPVDLMRWLVRLVTPPGGTVLEPFAGSGSTLQACLEEGVRVIGVEREATFYGDCCARLEAIDGEPKPIRERKRPAAIPPPESKPELILTPPLIPQRLRTPRAPTFEQHSFLESLQ